MAEFGFSAKVGADVSGFQKGMQKAEKSLKKFADGITNIGKKGIVGSLANVSLAMGGVVTAFRTATKVIKDVAKAVGECTEAYKQQAIVERTLQTAIQNNPYVTGNALSNLKQFASDMQRISNVGDEQIMQLETQLISLGRTEEETMNIIRVAMDMSASGTMSLDTAITQLNATLNGNIGRLGQQNAELKNLTEEELKSGKAVEILGEKFKGLSEATIDTSKQLKNIKGDFKEAIGEFTLPSSDMWNKFWMGFYEKGIDIVHKLQASLDSSRGEGIYEKLAGSVKKIKNEEEQRRAISDALSMSTEVELNQLQTYLEGLKKRNALQEKTLEQARATLQYRKDAEESYQRGLALEEQEEARRQAELDAQKEKENEIVKLKEEYLKKVAEQEAKWKNIKTITGEEVDAQEKIKFYQDGLVDLMTQAGGRITTNNQLYKDQIAIIQKLQSELEPEEEKTSDTWVKKIREQAIERLKAEKEAYDESVDLEKTTALERYLVRKEYNEKIFELEKEQLLAEREQALKSVEGVANEYEEKARIIEYYNKEVEALAKKQGLSMEKEGKKSGKAFAEGFSVVIKEIKNVMSKVIGTMKSVLGGAKNIFKKLFDFNPDDALTNLLIFEDKILTFFVETLPKLPQFFASAMQSISVLLDSILNSGGFDIIGDVITNIIKSLIRNIPQIIKGIVTVVEKITDELEPIFDRMIPVLGEVLVMVIDRTMKLLPKAIKIIIKAVSTLIQTIVKSLPAILKAIIPNLLKAVLTMIQTLLKELPKIITVLINALPDIISAVIEGLVEFLSNLTGKDIAMFITGVIKAVAQIAMALVKNIGKIVAELIPLVVQIIVELIKSIPDILKGLAEGVWDGIKWVGEKVWDGIKNIGSGLKNIGSKIKKGFKKLFGFATGTNNAPRGLALVGEAGPELVKFRGGEQVLNARNTQKALASAGGNTNNFNVTFNNLADTSAFAMIQQLKAYNRQMAINGII